MKLTKKTLSALLGTVVSASLVLAACGGSSTTENTSGENESEIEPIVLRMGDNQPESYPTVTGGKKFAEIVEEKTDGRITIDIYPNAQLGNDKEVNEQLQLGTIDLNRVSTGGALAEFNSDFGVFNLPFLFDDSEHLWRFLESEKAEELLQSLESNGMVGLAYYDAGSRNFYSTKPITKVEDLKGKKIRVQPSEVNIALMEALGASATPMAFGEVYSALSTGVIDGAENNYPSYVSNNHYEAAEHFILDGHQRVPDVIVISKITWDKLSAEDQKIIKEAAVESVKTQREAWAQFEADAEAQVKDVITVTEVEDITPWQEAVKSVIDKYRSKYSDILNAIDETRN
ncbi:TRAP transporter substrate-binding protein [Bacillus sp. B15-48]|uniref:TRAP transporter substrate-binding protein n=1 Tax=Bacillus sp. B15-48 TaxID=1548601 RepID=UPI00193EF145|nr:TRAP transporter substrate-binding protein [Bacillus sp. B15-48]MBM4761129.1 DctP family TRAP transporter solute-binding subunit [Bacillus sp. B15-48]